MHVIFKEIQWRAFHVSMFSAWFRVKTKGFKRMLRRREHDFLVSTPCRSVAYNKTPSETPAGEKGSFRWKTATRKPGI